MRSSNHKRSRANQVARSAINFQVSCRIVSDLTSVLLILRVTKEHSAYNLTPQTGTKFWDSASDDSGTLTVAARYNGGVGTLCVCLIEKPDCFINGCWLCATWQSIGGKIRVIWSTDALHPDFVYTVSAFEDFSDGRASGWALMRLSEMERQRKVGRLDVPCFLFQCWHEQKWRLPLDNWSCCLARARFLCLNQSDGPRTRLRLEQQKRWVRLQPDWWACRKLVTSLWNGRELKEEMMKVEMEAAVPT